jgi:DNA-binding transcriptional ArsR family regulator
MLTLQHVMKIMKALADPTRFRILQAIANTQERCCGKLTRDVPITQATVSQHLTVLTDADLVEPPPQGHMKPPRSLLRGITTKGIVCETPRFLTLFPWQGNLGASSKESPDSITTACGGTSSTRTNAP